MISRSHSTVLQASYLRLIHLQLKQAIHKMGVAWLPRGKTPKIKVLQTRVNILGPKYLLLPALVLSAARKATEPQTASKGVNCSLCLHLQAKTVQKMKNKFPNMETDSEKGCL